MKKSKWRSFICLLLLCSTELWYGKNQSDKLESFHLIALFDRQSKISHLFSLKLSFFIKCWKTVCIAYTPRLASELNKSNMQKSVKKIMKGYTKQKHHGFKWNYNTKNKWLIKSRQILSLKLLLILFVKDEVIIILN